MEKEKTKFADKFLLRGGVEKCECFLPILFFVTNLICVIIGNVFVGLAPIAKYFLIDISVLLFMSALIYLTKPIKLKLVISYFITILTIIICVANSCLYKVFGDIFYAQMIFLIEEASSVLDLSYFNIPAILIYIGILVFFIIFSHIYKKSTSKTNTGYKRSFFKTLAIFVALIMASGSMLSIFKHQISGVNASEQETIVSDQDLYDNLIFKYSGLSKFGFYGFYGQELFNFIFKSNLKIQDEDKNLFSIISNYNNNNKDELKYGTLKGQNLICILTESLEWGAIDPFLTPTLYDLYNNKSVCLTNYHAKNKTNMSENIVMYGMTPSSFNLSATPNNTNLNLPYSIANMLKNQNYTTSYYHAYLSKFYERNKILPNVGYDNLTFVDTIDLGYDNTTLNNSASDYDFFMASKDEFIPTNKSFYTQFASVSTHGTYANKKDHLANLYSELSISNSNYTLWKEYLKETYNYNLKEETTEGQYIINYKAGAIDLDNTIKAIFDDLTEKNLLDSTTIMLFADHNAYGNNLGNIIKGIDSSKIYDFEMYREPACIFSTKLSPQKIDSFVNTYDLYKTLCVLFGLETNDLICNGYNFFDENEIKNSFFISFTCGAFDNNYYSKDYSNIYYSNGTFVNDENEKLEFLMKVNKFFEKQTFIDKILYNNMFYNYKNK